jgi:CheY-like chemotaxis protein
MGSRILVIEDNPTNLELMTDPLNAFGHTTIVARDGEEGVKVALRVVRCSTCRCPDLRRLTHYRFSFDLPAVA